MRILFFQETLAINVMRNSALLLLWLLVVTTTNLFGQSSVPVLEREVTVSFNGEPVKSALDRIAAQGKFVFSYPSNLFDADKKVTLTVAKKRVREVLFLLFGNKVKYKAKGNYLILSAAPKAEIEQGNKEYYIINGYVTDGVTGDKIPSVSIFEGTKMLSTVTNKYGYFKIKIDETKVQLNLKVSKQNYRDTLITVRNTGTQNLMIVLHPERNEVSIDTVQTEESPVTFLIPDESIINTENIKDTIYRKYQVSFLPKLGTNYLLSGNVINDYSFNVIGGYSRGTRKFELAGMFNLDRGDVSKAQIAGFLNANGGTTNGFQLAGFLNLDKRSVNGIQIGGFGNINGDSTTGFQLGGFFNVNKGKSNACNIAGFANVMFDTSSGVQLAGFINSAHRSFDGVQLAGFGNHVIGNMKGVQLSGFYNFTSGEMSGVQVAGFVNYARKITGTQIGFINISDSCNGLPIGFLSFVRTGYHRFEIFTDEVFAVNASLRSGIESFHTMLFASMGPDKRDSMLWSFGYGIGSSVRLGKRWLMDFDLSAQQINKGSVGSKINLLNKFYVGAEYRISKGFYIAGGPVLNAQLTNTNYSHYPSIFNSMHPQIFYSDDIDKSTHVDMWVGGKVALRFF
jgi:hypothetical protein